MVNVINRYDKYQNTYKSSVLAQEAKSGYYTSTSNSDEWYTPPDIVELVLRVLKEIDLDPCAESDKKIPARLHYTLKDDGLQQDWHGRLFINPPFSCPGKWVEKLQDSMLSGANLEAIALLPTATDTDWLNSILKTQPICFLKERIKFLDGDYQPNLLAPHSHCLVYWGDHEQQFKEVFEEYGIVYLPVWSQSKNNHSSTQEVLPVSLTSSTTTTVEQQSQTVLPVNSTSSTNQKAPIQQQSQTVLPVSLTSSTKRRARGKGTGRIHWRTVTKKNGKQYEQAWYDWELNTETKTISRSTYIPKYLLSIILELEINKAPVNEILSMLGIIL
jgi:DNA N-6-adenine-methyltransferase (Dam)